MLKKSAGEKIVRTRLQSLGLIPENRQQLEMGSVAAGQQLACSFPPRARTVLFDQRQKWPESSSKFWWERPRKGRQVGCNTTSPSTRSSERFADFPVEIFLEARDDHINAQDFRRKGVPGAKLLRPCNPPPPFVLRHCPIISLSLPPRN